jgi:hypothetical protein
MPRRKRKINEETLRQIRVLASLGLSHEDIATVTGLARRTMERRAGEVLAEGRAQMRARLHRIQWDLATKSPTMAIWLGKQYLGQRDVPLPTDQQGAVIEYVHRVITTTTDSPSRNSTLSTSAGVRAE